LALAALALFSFGCNSKPAGKQHVKFPFGNYNQQWVAVANIETPVE